MNWLKNMGYDVRSGNKYAGRKVYGKEITGLIFWNHGKNVIYPYTSLPVCIMALCIFMRIVFSLTADGWR